MSAQNSGSSTPLSSSTTISSPGSPRLLKSSNLLQEISCQNPRTQASALIEFIASRQGKSSSVYVYDVAEQVGFGTLTKEWARTVNDSSRIVDLQTRAGAGLSLVGRLSQGTSLETAKGTVLTAYTTPSGLAMMAPSFAYLPPASTNSKLIIQVPAVTPAGETSALSPTLSALASVWPILPDTVSILLSSTPQQAVDFAALSYSVSDSHVIHLFDHHSSSREVGTTITPNLVSDEPSLGIRKAVEAAGYSFFEYHGSSEATTVIVLFNGPFALTLKAVIKGDTASNLGIVIVNVFRPLDEAALQAIIPASATTIHVLDDVPNSVTQGGLYVDVFGALWGAVPRRIVRSHRITPAQTQNFTTAGGSFLKFIEEVTTIQISKPPSDDSKKLLLFSVPKSPLSSLPMFIEELFLTKAGIHTRLLTDHDVFSKPGGITASRLLISRNNVTDTLPIPVAFPIDSHSTGHSDFLGILDQGLLKTHSLLQHAKPGSTVLVVSSWTPEEFLSNLPQGVHSFIAERNLFVYLIDSKAIAAKIVGAQGPIQDAVQNLLVELAFLRLYLGGAANEGTVLQLAKASFDEDIQGIPLAKYNAFAWSSLQVVDIQSAKPAETLETPSLKDFESNAIAVETEGGTTVVNGARLSTWHDAAKHLLFPSVYAPEQDISELDNLRNPALRPEVPETTFLVTCTVNKRLTPLEYDRNVFHLEFDTSGTGLKYSIGEALGIHGWNDEQEVVEFCDWYGADPNRLITIPLPSDETKMHTRTVLQALQQQIDLFGKPPKSFYTDLAEYASNDVDRYALRFIGAPEGVATFKKLSEKDTVNFSDVLKMYPSARPGIERLCEMVGDIKPRHYSIASAQSVVGDRVDLLVVTVDWLTPSGKHSRCCEITISLINFFLVPRVTTIWTMHSLSRWPESGSKGHCIDQTQRDEGMHISYLEVLLKLTERHLAASKPKAASHYGRPWYWSSAIPCVLATSGSSCFTG